VNVTKVAGGLDPASLVAGAYDTRRFSLGAKTKAIFAGSRKVDVRQPHQRMIVLPNGHTVNVSRDASGCATQIEENHRLHGVARPLTYKLRLKAVDQFVDEIEERRKFIEQCQRFGVRVPRRILNGK
jgi:hypothetical protein